MGNPLTFGGWHYTWQQGRQLAEINGNGYTISYQYDDSGIRTQKTVNGAVTNYVLDGSNVIFEENGTDSIWYDYTADGALIGFELNGTPYYYMYNLQGDITSIVDANGTTAARYAYDAWGNLISMTDGSGADISSNPSAVGYKNPYRYRGYRYDTETGLYYLQSRYYNPALGRFMNEDAIVDTGSGVLGSNMFAYCDNNPVNNADPSGRALINVVCAAIGGLVGWYFGDYVAKRLGYKSGWKYWAIRAGVTIGGAVIGWFAGTAISKVIASYLKANPVMVFRLTSKWGAGFFSSAMRFLGINPFSLVSDSSKFIALARLFNTPTVSIGLSWAQSLASKARTLGYKLTLHSGHGWGNHLHISGGLGKLSNLHIKLSQDAYNYLSKILK